MSAIKVLVIEDTTELAYQFRIRLNAAGYEVEVATNGHDGLEKARTVRPDLILLDLMLPEVDGYRICRFIKFDKEFEHIPIIIVTARTLEQDRELALEAGADAYFIKPIDWKGLLEKMDQLISSKQGKSQSQPVESPNHSEANE